MVDVEYMVSYSQVLEILKYISKEDYNKIPKDMINLFKTNCYKKSNFRYNPEKTLQEQNVTETTKTIIAILFRDYWATEEQRTKIIKVQEQEKLRQKDVNDIFKRNNIAESKIEQSNNSGNVPVIIKKENILKRIITFIKNIIRL